MKNLKNEQQISPSDSRRALPVDENATEDKVSELLISNVLDGLLYCKKNECQFCPYDGLNYCVDCLLADARKVIKFLQKHKKTAYVAPTVEIVKG